ncbi:PTS transporter subunit EIIB [Spiroplasma turonicum]|uniref:PTS system trehalose-specific IIBC component n=1 Tax=Spiroplasma turonicum TaxID=216946 RepID=A0A0K1P6C1_9MOLU|nr:PTS transporter subunit EIIB [Spiroplasma turonicum]AKU79856.1 PTS system trehalose-specific IIBC component [Spiroplasma turonicum]ALX70874.1 PTS system, trehalose-specific IIBC component [Spiroplasma turonicum]
MKLFIKKKEVDPELKKLIQLLGNVDNIENVNHCSTRMRITLKNTESINITDIENLDLINGVILKDKLLQFAVKKSTEEFNKEFLVELGVNIKRLTNLFDVKLNIKKSFFKWLTDGIGVLFTPLFPYAISLALVATIGNIINNIEVNGLKIKDLGKFAYTLGSMFESFQNALVLTFSILIPWTIFKMMKGSQSLGISLGVVLCAKDLASTNMFMQGDGKLFDWGLSSSEGFKWSFSDYASGYPWKISFEGQILTLVLIGFMAVYIERLAKKIKSGVVRELLGIPMVLIIPFFVGLLLIAPIGMLITYGMNLAITWATITNPIAKYIFNPIIGLLLPWMVVTGFIHIFNVVGLQQFITYGAMSVAPMCTQLNIAVATSTMVIALLHKKNKELQKVATPSYLIAYIGGSTEAALFGVSLRFLFPVLATSIGTAVGCTIITASGTLTTMGPVSLLVFLCVIQDAGSIPGLGINTWAGTGFLWMAVALASTIASTFLLTVLFSRIGYFKRMTKDIIDRDFAPLEGENNIDKKIKKIKE